MKSFREIIITESPVGSRGRTSKMEAQSHIENNGLEKKFMAIVKELGGKTAARLLLAQMDSKGEKVDVTEKAQTIEAYLRDSGYKIKLETPTRGGKEIDFFKPNDAKAAFEDLKTAGFGDTYDIDLAHATITYK